MKSLDKQIEIQLSKDETENVQFHADLWEISFKATIKEMLRTYKDYDSDPRSKSAQEILDEVDE